MRCLKCRARAEARRREAQPLGGGCRRGSAPPERCQARRRPQVGASNGPWPGLAGPFPFSFVVGQEPCARRGRRPACAPTPCAPAGGRAKVDQGRGWLGGALGALPLAPQRAHRRVRLPAGAGPECSRPASVIWNRWMGGGRRPALPPIAVRAGAGREGGRRGRLGPRGRQRARLPSAARACPGAGLGLAEAPAGTWVRKLKPAAGRWGGRPGGGGPGLPPGSEV